MGGSISWAQEVDTAVGRDHTTALQVWRQSNPVLQKKKEKKKKREHYWDNYRSLNTRLYPGLQYYTKVTVSACYNHYYNCCRLEKWHCF